MKETVEEMLKEIKNTFDEQGVKHINEMLEEGITLDEILDQIDSGIHDELVEHKGIESLSDLILVHKTNYIPENETIKTSKNAGAITECEKKIAGKKYKYQIKNQRDTVHFDLNGEVTSHAAGSFDGRKYTVLIPFEKIQQDKIGMAIGVDTFIDGNVEIPVGSFLLCPQSEREEIAQNAENLIVIGYEGETVDGYANKFLEKVLGYKIEEIGSIQWGDRDHKDEEKLYDILEKNGIKNGDLHGGTIEFKQELGRTQANSFCALFNEVKDEITDEKTYNEVKEALYTILTASSHDSDAMVCLLDSEIQLNNYLFDEIESQLGITIPKEKIKEIHDEFDDNDRWFSANKIADELVDYVILNPILDLPISELSNKDREILKSKVRNMLEGKKLTTNFKINPTETTVESYLQIIEEECINLSKQEKEITRDDLEKNNEKVLAKERQEEPSKMKQLEKQISKDNEQNIEADDMR